MPNVRPHLVANTLRTVDSELFGLGVSQLRVLDLRNNRLSDIREATAIANKLSNLEFIGLRGEQQNIFLTHSLATFNRINSWKFSTAMFADDLRACALRRQQVLSGARVPRLPHQVRRRDQAAARAARAAQVHGRRAGQSVSQLASELGSSHH
jgi:hypothetical protein